MNSWIIAISMIRRTLGTKKGFVLSIMLGFLLPAVIIAVLVSFIGGGSGEAKAKIAYVDLDQSHYSKYIVQELSIHPSLSLTETDSEERASSLVIEMDVSSAFIIPAGYGEEMMAGTAPQLIQIRLSMSAATFTLEQALQAASANLAQMISVVQETGDGAEELLSALLEQQQKRQVSTTITKVVESKDVYIMIAIVGFMLMFLMIVTNQSITTIVEDRRNQTMSRVYASPVRSFQIALGYFLGSFMLSTMQVLFILLISRFIFRFDYGVPFLAQFIILECFILAALGIASAVGSLVRNSDQLSLINNLVMTPTCMIGGCFWPISFMPDFMQKIANFVPQRWAIDAMSQLADGAGLSDVLIHIGILILFAVVLLGFGSAVLKPSQAGHK